MYPKKTKITPGSVARILKNHFILRNPRDETYESLIPKNERLIPKNQLRHNGATARILKNGIIMVRQRGFLRMELFLGILFLRMIPKNLLHARIPKNVSFLRNRLQGT